MGKPSARKKKSSKRSHSKSSERSSKNMDEDTTIFIDMARDLKEEGNALFQRREYEKALLKYEKAIKLLPKNHIDLAYLHSNLAACYMAMSPEEYHHAIDECNLALEVSPKYSKALLKRAKCFEALGMLELARKDVDVVLSMEPSNLTALEISERLKMEIEKRGTMLEEKAVYQVPESPEPLRVKQMTKKNKSIRSDEKDMEPNDLIALEISERVKKEIEKAGSMFLEEKPVYQVLESPEPLPVKQRPKQKSIRSEEKEMEEILAEVKKEEPMKNMKLVFGEDIRWAQVQANCTILQLREIVGNKYPVLKAFLVKYKDKEGDLVTITTSEELKWAEKYADSEGSLKLYIVEVEPDLEPLLDESKTVPSSRRLDREINSFSENGSIKREDDSTSSVFVDDWIVQFARLLKNHVGFDSDAYLNLHELGMKLHSEAMEDTVTSEDAQEAFELAEEKFQEMTALAFFNWGNVHMSRARKSISLSEEGSKESMLAEVKAAYDWAQEEYVKAGKCYEDAMKVKPNFYEGVLAVALQQFEQAKLTWYYAIGSKEELEKWPSSVVQELFDCAEDNIQKGTEMWEEAEEQRLKNLSKPNDEKALLQKMGLEDHLREISTDEAAELASNMRAQINILWGTILYERSVMEFKLDIPTWEESLMAAVEKFKLAGATPTDIAVMMKNHCANENAQEGLGFKIDEIVQAWNEMYDAKKWMHSVSSFRLEPLLRRRVPKLHSTLSMHDL